MHPQLSGTKEIIGYGHWLIMRGQHAGNLCFDGHTATAEERDITRKFQMLSNLIDKQLKNCKQEDVGGLLDCYDITYRLGFNNEPAPEFIDRHRRRVLRAWLDGDRNIEESSLYGLLSPMMIRNCGTKDKKEYETAWLTIRDKWMETLKRNSYFPDATSYENYQRLALVNRENIIGYFNDDSKLAKKTKREWYKYNKVEDLSTLGSQILRSYRRFASSLFPDILEYDEQMDLDNRILTELSSRTDLDPYDRKAFSLALEYNKELV